MEVKVDIDLNKLFSRLRKKHITNFVVYLALTVIDTAVVVLFLSLPDWVFDSLFEYVIALWVPVIAGIAVALMCIFEITGYTRFKCVVNDSLLNVLAEGSDFWYENVPELVILRYASLGDVKASIVGDNLVIESSAESCSLTKHREFTVKRVSDYNYVDVSDEGICVHLHVSAPNVERLKSYVRLV